MPRSFDQFDGDAVGIQHRHAAGAEPITGFRELDGVRLHRPAGIDELVVERVDVVDREPDVAGAGPFQREGRAIGGTDVFEQLQHLPVTQIEVGAQQPGAGHAGDPLDLVARELPHAPHRELEQVAVERERSRDVARGDRDVVQPQDPHMSPLGPSPNRSGTISRRKTSSTVSARFTTSARSPCTRTVAGRGRALKLLEAAS